jgi:predicted aldo/keto reductase-like oxidoreductase
MLMGFFTSYEIMVLYECSKQTKSMLEHAGIKVEGTIEETALKYLIDNDDIDYILVGMRKTKYVHSLLKIEG